MLRNWTASFGRKPIPTDNLAAHYDASVASSITEVTGVSNWADLSGNGRDLVQLTGADQPVYSAANNSITFDGVSDFLKTAAFTLNQPETVYMACQQVSYTSGDYLMDGDINTGLIYQGTSSPNIQAYAGSFSSDNGDLAVGSDGVVAVVFNGASSSIRVDNNAPVTGNFGAANMGSFTLGTKGNSAAAQASNIIVYEVAIYSVAHTASQQNNIIHDLQQKWGIS